jgi:hypothetical protein
VPSQNSNTAHAGVAAIKAPAKTRDVKPVYPAAAKSAKIAGTVIIEFTPPAADIRRNWPEAWRYAAIAVARRRPAGDDPGGRGNPLPLT